MLLASPELENVSLSRCVLRSMGVAFASPLSPLGSGGRGGVSFKSQREVLETEPVV